MNKFFVYPFLLCLLFLPAIGGAPVDARIVYDMYRAEPQNDVNIQALIVKAEKGNAKAQNELGDCYYYGRGVSQDYVEAVRWYRKAEEQGDATAQYNLGICYEYGQGVLQDYAEAVKWYRKAAEQGNADAQCNLGVCYDYGRGVLQDYAEAVRWFRKAAEQGDATAQCNLGVCYKNGRGVIQDYAEEVKWYRKAAEQGNADGQCNLGNCYYNGRGVLQDYAEAVRWFRKAAEQGNARAQCNLGICYENGRGVLQDYAEAVRWYRKAAEQEYASAQCNLGVCYDYGRGVLQDYAEAVRWFRKAAEQGNARAQYNLGVCYDYGKGVLQDYAEAVRWYRKAAEQGYAMAQCNLGICYENGRGVLQDYAEAVRWYRKAAEQEYARAQNNLGACYKNGRGVLQDYAEAVRWYRKAAEQGNADAQNNLGICYENGRGVSQDYAEAVRWFRKAAEQGYADAKKQLAKLGGSNQTPNPSPTKTVATIDWLAFPSTTTENQYTLKAGIKSTSKIESWRVLLNNVDVTNDKGSNPVKADGYVMMIEKLLMLAKGENHIKIEIVNEGGLVTSEKTIVCKANDVVVQEKRLALVIGNAAYKNPCFGKLDNALNDAKVMYDELKSLGFEMRPLVLDADRMQMWDAIGDFIDEVDKGNYGVALLYYSGHGLSPDGGANYLIPVDAKIKYLDEVKRDGINSQTQLIAKLEEKKCRVKIALLDCCNNCNVPERDVKSVANQGGLSLMRPSHGISILHAAHPGRTALDKLGMGSQNSPFVEAFLECVSKYSAHRWSTFVEELTNTVNNKTGGRQIPYHEGQLLGAPFYLNPDHQ